MSYQTLIDATNLSRLIEAGAVLVCDCRFDLNDPEAGRRDYLQGHIPGARYVDLDRDMSAAPTGANGRHPLPDRSAFAARMAALGLRKDMLVVSYDASGGFYASRLWWMLRWAGHHHAAVLDGGFEAWKSQGLPLRSGDEPPPGIGDFTASPEPAMPSIDVSAVVANLRKGDLLVVDARTAERFHGAPHPLDSASGHIPGAANRFYQHNLAPDGRFKSPGELRNDFRAVLGNTPSDKVVHQCGSGVTATHNLLAMEVAGLTGSRLYPGSWSEWTSDPERPITTD